MARDLSDLTDDELVKELSRRKTFPGCPCGKWQTYLGRYDADGYTLRCHGCIRAVAKCTCR